MFKIQSTYRKLTQISFIFSPCIPEGKLCLGVPLCNNLKDLFWCKSEPIVADVDWVPFWGHAHCAFDHQSNESLTNRQWVAEDSMKDGLIYHCINRADEDPFSGTTKDENKTTWLQFANLDCPSENQLRCLGGYSDACISRIECKYPLY